VGNDFEDVVSIPNNGEVEAPAFVDASLPAAVRFVVFLGVERRVMEILRQKFDLFEEGLLDGRRCTPQRFVYSSAVFNSSEPF
jgi:hypothetical protein